MNIELKPRLELFSMPVAAPANDNREPRSARPRRRAIIYKPARSAMTSGRAWTKRWLLEFEPQSPPFIEPLMGWTGSTDPLAHMRLTFPSREAAIVFAKRQGWDYEVSNDRTSPKAIAVLPHLQPLQIPLSPAALPASASDVEVGRAA
jgi:hypothetical protein